MKNKKQNIFFEFCFRQAYKVLVIWNRIRRPLTLGVVAAIFNESGQILLVRHSYRKGWYLPAGGVKKGESVQEAICRELWEELGIKLSQESLKIRGVFYNRCDGKHDHAVFFEVRDFKGEVAPHSFEIAELSFFPLTLNSEGDISFEKLPADLGGSSKRLILSCLKGGV